MAETETEKAGGTELQYSIIAPSDCFQLAPVNNFFTFVVTPSMGNSAIILNQRTALYWKKKKLEIQVLAWDRHNNVAHCINDPPYL